MKRQTILATVPGLDIRLTWYQPGEAMSAHVHDRHQVSWLLGGEMRETSGSRERDLLQVSRGVKPAGCSHANDYGPAGALILALNIDPDAGFGRDLAGLDDWVWSPAADAAPGEIIRIAAAMADGGVPVSLALSDLAACIAVSDEPRSGTDSPLPAPWLRRVRDALREPGSDPEIARLADEAGVHRVHLSRSFTRHYGVSPSLYRLHCKLGRAIAGLMQGDSAVEAAQAGGFADQPHFTRAARRQTGLTPRHLRSLLAA